MPPWDARHPHTTHACAHVHGTLLPAMDTLASTCARSLYTQVVATCSGQGSAHMHPGLRSSFCGSVADTVSTSPVVVTRGPTVSVA